MHTAPQKNDNAVIGSDLVECEGWKNNILGNCFFSICHLGRYNGSDITIIYSINNTYCTKKYVFYAVQDDK